MLSKPHIETFNIISQSNSAVRLFFEKTKVLAQTNRRDYITVRLLRRNYDNFTI